VRRLALVLVAGALAACGVVPVPRASPYHPSDADLSVTRIVHASLVLELRGTRVVVDPWFHSGWLRRQSEPLGLLPDAVPDAGAVLLTHRHTEHFDPRALRALAARVPRAVGRPEMRGVLEELGFREVTTLDWWERTTVGGITVTAVPARHSVPENGYVLEAGEASAYVAGDTAWFRELVDVATRFPRLDVALLPVGGKRLLGVRREMGPEEAARAAALLGPRRVIPIAYGTRGGFPFYWFARRPAERFVDECKKRGVPTERVVVLQPGESWHYYR
jgi:L-ascorbate metabolism protein UlaG (beta-lactamase superfamily)